jgi:hypothetical protein
MVVRSQLKSDTAQTYPCPSLYCSREGPGSIGSAYDLGSSVFRLKTGREKWLVAIGAGIAVFADFFLCPFARQGLLHAALLARLQVIRVALYFLDNVFGLDFTFETA